MILTEFVQPAFDLGLDPAQVFFHRGGSAGLKLLDVLVQAIHPLCQGPQLRHHAVDPQGAYILVRQNLLDRLIAGAAASLDRVLTDEGIDDRDQHDHDAGHDQQPLPFGIEAGPPVRHRCDSALYQRRSWRQGGFVLR